MSGITVLREVVWPISFQVRLAKIKPKFCHLAQISRVTPVFSSLVASPLHFLNVNDGYDNYSRVIL